MNKKGTIRNTIFKYLVVSITIINIILIGVSLAIWIGSAQQNLFIGTDFTNLFTGFKMVLNGDGAKLYDLALQAKYQQEIMGDISFESGLLPYLNPPFIALIFSPLALLSISGAFYLWTIGELGLLIWLIVLINRLFSDWTKKERLVMTLSILAFWPLTITFLFGQFSLLFLTCILQMYIGMGHSKLGRAGLWLVLLAIKPQILPIPGMMAVNKRYWHVAVTAVISGIVLVIISSAFLGFGTWLNYFQVLPAMSTNFGKFGFLPDAQFTVRGLLTNILGHSQGGIINIISIVVFVAGVIFVWLLWRIGIPADSQRFKLIFALTILLSAFFSLHLYPHDDLILVLPTVLFYDYLRQNNYPRKAYSLVILLTPVIFFITAFSSFNLFGVIRPPVVVILILLVWMLVYLAKDFRSIRSGISTAI